MRLRQFRGVLRMPLAVMVLDAAEYLEESIRYECWVCRYSLVEGGGALYPGRLGGNEG